MAVLLWRWDPRHSRVCSPKDSGQTVHVAADHVYILKNPHGLHWRPSLCQTDRASDQSLFEAVVINTIVKVLSNVICSIAPLYKRVWRTNAVRLCISILFPFPPVHNKKLYISQPATLHNEHRVKENGLDCIVHMWRKDCIRLGKDCVPFWLVLVWLLSLSSSGPGSNCQCAEPLNEQLGGISLVLSSPFTHLNLYA